jgi:hypothetical protein
MPLTSCTIHRRRDALHQNSTNFGIIPRKCQGTSHLGYPAAVIAITPYLLSGVQIHASQAMFSSPSTVPKFSPLRLVPRSIWASISSKRQERCWNSSWMPLTNVDFPEEGRPVSHTVNLPVLVGRMPSRSSVFVLLTGVSSGDLRPDVGQSGLPVIFLVELID